MIVVILKIACILFTSLQVRSCISTNQDLEVWAHTRWNQLGDRPCAFLSGGDAESNEDLKVNVKVFLFQKDEEEVLGDWLQYYSYMFGANNLVVIDHESHNPDVCKVLELYKLCGTRVVPFSGPFSKKHVILTEEMHKYNDTILLPLDADEFIVTEGNSTMEINRASLHQAFNKLPIDGRKYKFKYSYFARPNATVCYDSVALNRTENPSDHGNRRAVTSQLAVHKALFFSRSKSFYHSTGFVYTDQGNHFGKVEHDRGLLNDHAAIESNLTHYFAPLDASLLHYSMSSYASRRNKFLRGYAAYNFTLRTDCSRVGNGVEYCYGGKSFLNVTDDGRAFYLKKCLPQDTAQWSLASVSAWFLNHAHSLTGIVGA